MSKEKKEKKKPIVIFTGKRKSDWANKWTLGDFGMVSKVPCVGTRFVSRADVAKVFADLDAGASDVRCIGVTKGRYNNILGLGNGKYPVENSDGFIKIGCQWFYKGATAKLRKWAAICAS